MRSRKAIEQKYRELEAGLSKNQSVFFVEDAEHIWGRIQKNSVYWYLSALIDAGYIRRIRKGMYALKEWKEPAVTAMSSAATEIAGLLDESGFYYYVSGLDVLAGFMLHVPEQYPVILFAEKEAKDEVSEILVRGKMRVIEPTRLKSELESAFFRHTDLPLIVLYPTTSFEYSCDGRAEAEKAFIDLYYAVTRNAYPLAIQELARIYENMRRTGGIDEKRLIRAAKARSIHYDIRFIVESGHITKEARMFDRILNGRKTNED